MNNSPFSGLGLIERLSWSMFVPEVWLVSVIHAATAGCVDVCVFVAAMFDAHGPSCPCWDQVNVHDPSCRQKSC